MVSFSSIDLILIAVFFISLLIIGFAASRSVSSNAETYLLSNRNLGLFLFVLVNVSTWYGGILGVGEFTYRYGIVSWVTQGLPYYIFAFLFALLFAKKIREASLFTIPDKLRAEYGNAVGLISAVIVFILVSPAPYLLMVSSLLSLVTGISLEFCLLISLILSLSYIIFGGFKSTVYTDVMQFFVMFIGFGVLFFVALTDYGGLSFIKSNVPEGHLTASGDLPPFVMIVWFLIALWTFADPGFHQRCYAAKTGKIASKGILISIIFFALFDLLTTTSGLYAKAIILDLDQPMLAYPMLAEKILSPGLKGLFYAALFATIISTLNSFLFLSGTTIGRDFIFQFTHEKSELELRYFTIIGLIISSIIAFILSNVISSVIQIWYTLGSLCIPGILIGVISSYYPKLKISSSMMVIEMIAAVSSSILWLILQDKFPEESTLSLVEPMLIGLLAAIVIHTIGLTSRFFLNKK
ncbi:MAG: sodium:solute symporter family protein [Ignavibacteriales bacterium]|nr:MAG: sodium:solute symporter family protein [Ignavibacteriales bacterium]